MKQSINISGRKYSTPRVTRVNMVADTRSRLYHNSHHTFLSMTTRRAVSTTSALALYPSDIGENSVHTNPVIIPGSPTAPKAPPKHIRQTSYTGSLRSKASLESLRGEGEGYIAFKKLEDVERKGLMEVLKRKGPGR